MHKHKKSVINFNKILNFLAGENAKFEVQLKDRVSTVEWLKNNKVLDKSDAERVTVREDANNTFFLELHNCSETDTGLYTAKAIHGLETSSCTAQLIVEKCKFYNI